jgi:hypothetical protein
MTCTQYLANPFKIWFPILWQQNFPWNVDFVNQEKQASKHIINPELSEFAANFAQFVSLYIKIPNCRPTFQEI